ncbi:flagellin [Hasllibacter sp. MH4015]|uniref:flagellin n=1 Tax=Hasllibacter sp. MH4015 TaxID=2854029 RepID=UPI001CD3CE87|nr:flagellin [Hasllibacter sp. MH4015]
MSLTTYGDLAQFHMLRRDSAQLKSDLVRLTGELSSGKTADIGRALGGDFSTLADIARSLRLNASFSASVAEASIAAEGRQSALGRIAAELDGFAPQLLSVTGAGSWNDIQLTLANGSERFDAAVDALNTRLAGRSLFSADEPDATPLAGSEAILDELRLLVGTTTDAATAEADVRAWFMSPGGGYETMAWQGGAGAAPEVLLGEGRSAETGVTALDPAIRESLIGLALVALAEEEAAPLDETEKRALVTGAAEQMQRGEGQLITLRAALGAEEARIEEARVASQAARASLEIEYGRLVEADPYRTATDLETVNTRLESLYILTARLSRLSLTEFIR